MAFTDPNPKQTLGFLLWYDGCVTKMSNAVTSNGIFFWLFAIFRSFPTGNISGVIRMFILKFFLRYLYEVSLAEIKKLRVLMKTKHYCKSFRFFIWCEARAVNLKSLANWFNDNTCGAQRTTPRPFCRSFARRIQDKSKFFSNYSTSPKNLGFAQPTNKKRKILIEYNLPINAR